MDDATQDFQDFESDQDRLARLCQRLALPSGPLSGPGPARELADRIIAGIRDGRPPDELAADLQELERLLAGQPDPAGFPIGSRYAEPTWSILDGSAPGARSAPTTYAPLPGLGHGHPLLEVLACPTGLCTRVEPPAAGDAAEPQCRVLDQPLRRMRLQQ